MPEPEDEAAEKTVIERFQAIVNSVKDKAPYVQNPWSGTNTYGYVMVTGSKINASSNETLKAFLQAAKIDVTVDKNGAMTSTSGKFTQSGNQGYSPEYYFTPNAGVDIAAQTGKRKTTWGETIIDGTAYAWGTTSNLTKREIECEWDYYQINVYPVGEGDDFHVEYTLSASKGFPGGGKDSQTVAQEIQYIATAKAFAEGQKKPDQWAGYRDWKHWDKWEGETVTIPNGLIYAIIIGLNDNRSKSAMNTNKWWYPSSCVWYD